MPPQLIIFDCDGILVDSEPLSNSMFIDALAEIGFSMTMEECRDLFVGRSPENNIETIERMLGSPLPKDFLVDLGKKTDAAFEQYLRPVPGIESALREITFPVCVASSSPPEMILENLRRTGLLPRFEGRIFSATQVVNGKPAPDLFLHAAQVMKAPAESCAVIEDSVAGVQAGTSAGMTVFAYTGTFSADSLKDAGAHIVFDDMRQLPELLD